MTNPVNQKITVGYAKFNEVWQSAINAPTSQARIERVQQLLNMQVKFAELAKRATLFPPFLYSADDLNNDIANKINEVLSSYDFKNNPQPFGGSKPFSSSSSTQSSSGTSKFSSNPKSIPLFQDDFGPELTNVNGYSGFGNMSMGNCWASVIGITFFNNPALKGVFTTIGEFYSKGNTPDGVRIIKFFELAQEEPGFLSEQMIALFKAMESDYVKLCTLEELIHRGNEPQALRLMELMDDGSSLKILWTKLIEDETNPKNCVKTLLDIERPKEKAKEENLKKAGTYLLEAVEQYEQYCTMKTSVPPIVSQKMRLALHYFNPTISDVSAHQEDAARAMEILMSIYREIIDVKKGSSPLYSLLQEKSQYQPAKNSAGECIYRQNTGRAGPLPPENTKSTVKYEHQISLNAPHDVQDATVEALLAAFFDSDIQGDEQVYFQCPDVMREQAFSRSHVTRKFTGHRSPQALNIVIDRGGQIRLNEEFAQTYKVTNRVIASRLMVLPANATLKNKPLVYSLNSFFIQKGTISSGHYIAYIYDKKEDQWLMINDRKVCTVSKNAIDVILRCGTDNPSFTPYVLNYQLVPAGEQETILKLAAELNTVAPIDETIPLAPPLHSNQKPGPSKLPEPLTLSKKVPGPTKLPEPPAPSKKDIVPSSSSSIIIQGEQLIDLLKKLQELLQDPSYKSQEILQNLEEIQKCSQQTYNRLFNLIGISAGMRDTHYIQSTLLKNPTDLLKPTLPWLRGLANNRPNILEQCIQYEQERLQIHREIAAGGDPDRIQKSKMAYLKKNMKILHNLLMDSHVDDKQRIAIFDMLDLPREKLYQSIPSVSTDIEYRKKLFMEAPWILIDPLREMLKNDKSA